MADKMDKARAMIRGALRRTVTRSGVAEIIDTLIKRRPNEHDEFYIGAGMIIKEIYEDKEICGCCGERIKEMYSGGKE